jgi:hypothetical protein
MYLDDDVVLGDDCVAQLVAALENRRDFAALAADSADEMREGFQNWDYPRHVGMAAAMFRREHLKRFEFRWEQGKCECKCCCDDLRRMGFGVGYVRGAVAWHRPMNRQMPVPETQSPRDVRSHISSERGSRRSADRDLAPQILSAFNRRDHEKFRRQFMRSLRATGNHENVIAFAYGLYPSERMRLATQRNVRVVGIPNNEVSPSLRRLHDFQDAVERLPAEMPVAYWDAGDVIFQESLEPLWDLVRTFPDQLLVAREAKSYPQNPIIVPWTNRIRDPDSRRWALGVIAAHPFLNSGFAAGTASAMLRYLREGDRLLKAALRGVDWWGDQVALNLFCHTNPAAWREISETWNFALAGRDRWTFQFLKNGRVATSDGNAVKVAHGNSGTLGPAALPFLL